MRAAAEATYILVINLYTHVTGLVAAFRGLSLSRNY